MTEAPVRIYGRQQLATLYYPDITPRCAWKKLRHELRLNPRLAPSLDVTRRSFTVREVRQIFFELGAPEL